jgi:23S rRNA (cytidine1920-2'-O)/16S rRNA (cytidine1409-2'-O)-methyltransferase
MTRKRSPKNSSPRLRADLLLVRRNLAPDVKMALAMIMAGQVRSGELPVTAPSQLIPEDGELSVTPLRRFVSRGGDKLQHALEDLKLLDSLAGKVVLDVGAATGGFTHCCLERGARLVIALDVGTGLLDWSLRNDPRVTNLEGTHIKDFDRKKYPPIEWVVADISFNSLQRLAPLLRRAAPDPGTSFLLLVKPQFELRAEDVPHGGIVTSDAMREKAVQSARTALEAVGLCDGIAIDSHVAGRHGNREVFFYATARQAFAE